MKNFEYQLYKSVMLKKFQNQNSFSYKLFQCQQDFPFENISGGDKISTPPRQVGGGIDTPIFGAG